MTDKSGAVKVTGEAAEHREASHQAQTFKQLTIAHTTSILVYSRSGSDNNTKDLVRKFRPEFEQIFVFNDAKSCFSFIEEKNYDMEHQEISLVLLEADAVSMKVLDYLNKRTSNPETCSFPVIASVVLLPPNADAELKKSIDAVGGAGGMIQLPSSSKDILAYITDVLYRRKLVESSYRALQVISTADGYPFLPIFSEEAPVLTESVIEKSARAGSMPGLTGLDSIGGDSLSPRNDMAYIVTKNNDDWTVCNSMLPNFVKRARRKLKSRGSIEGDGEGTAESSLVRTSASPDVVHMTPAEKLSYELIDRKSADTKILKKLRVLQETKRSQAVGGAPLDELVPHDGDVARKRRDSLTYYVSEEDVNFAGENDEDESSLGAPDDDSASDYDTDTDARSSALSGDEASSLGGTGGAHSTARGGAHHPKSTIKTVKENVKHLLDPSKRPKWGIGNYRPPKNASLSVESAMIERELRPFVEKQEPNLAIRRTAGGLDKDVADRCWKVINSKGIVADEGAYPLRRMESSNSMGLRSLAMSVAATTSSKKNLAGADTPTDKSDSNITSPEYSTHSGKLDRDSSPGMGMGSATMGRFDRAARKADAANNSEKAVSETGGMSKASINFPIVLKKATKTLNKFVKQLPPDIILHRLMEVDLNNRKINVGDRELFERGLRYELNNETEQAIACYVRARKQSKDPQLPRLFLGGVYYKMGKYLEALNHYNAAIRIISETKGAFYSKHDDFCARYNRAITNLRLGEDLQGLHDLERATNIFPKNAQAKEVLAVVQRRLGDFNHAISNTLQSTAIRHHEHVEKTMKEFAEETKRQTRKTSPSSSASRPRTVASPEADAIRQQLLNKSSGSPAQDVGANAFMPLHRVASRDQNSLDGKDGEGDASVDNSLPPPVGMHRLPSIADESEAEGEPEAEGGGISDRSILDGDRVQRALSVQAEGSVSTDAGEHNMQHMTKSQAAAVSSLLATDSMMDFNHRVDEKIDLPAASRAASPSTVMGNVSLVRKGSPKRPSTATRDPHAHHRKSLTPAPIQHELMIRESEDRSLRARTAKAIASLQAEAGGSEAALNSFKASIGYKASLFESFFVKPSPLQVALGCRPKLRTKEHLEEIMTALRLFPFLRGASENVIKSLAGCIEYRTLTSQGQLFGQNEPADAAIFLLKGKVQMRMEWNESSHKDAAAASIIVGDLEVTELFGHIDFQFRHEDSPLITEIQGLIDMHARILAGEDLEGDRFRPELSQAAVSRMPSNHQDKGLDGSRHSLTARRSAVVIPSGFGAVDDLDASQHSGRRQSLMRRNSSAQGGHRNDEMNGSGGRRRSSMLSSDTPRRSSMLSVSQNRIDSLLRDRHSAVKHSTGGESRSGSKSFANPAQALLHQLKEKAAAKDKQRDLSPGMFMSYTMMTPCELLVIGEAHFNKLLYEMAAEEFRARFQLINSSGAFHMWSIEDRVRLARMGVVRNYKSGDLILQQGEQPTHLFFIMKGMCKAYKHPHEKEVYAAKLAILKQKAVQFDTKYVFDHKLRRTIKIHEGSPILDPIGPEKAGKATPQRQSSMSAMSPKHTASFSANLFSPASNQDLHKSPSGNALSPMPHIANRSSLKSPSTYIKHQDSMMMESPAPHMGAHTKTSSSHSLKRQDSGRSSVSSSSARHEIGKKDSNSVLPFSPGSLPSQSAMPRMFSQVERATRMAKARSMFTDYQYLTEREAERRQLAIEIANLETLIEKANAQEMKESALRENEYLFSMNSGRMSINSDPVDSSMHGTRRTAGGGQKKRGLFDTSKLCEIATLQWPMLFGEACVIDPDGGLSRGTIVADTTCDIFVIHKSQMQTFHIEKDFIDNIQQKSVSYPDDTVLVASLAKKEGWMKLREAMLAEIPKGRWPSRADDVEPMVF